MNNRFSLLAKLFIFGFMGLFFPQVITLAQEPGKDDIKRWNSVKNKTKQTREK